MKIEILEGRGGYVARCEEMGIEAWRVPRYLAVGACMADVLEALAKGTWPRSAEPSASARRIVAAIESTLSAADVPIYVRGLQALAREARGSYSGGPLTGILANLFELEGDG